METTEGQNKGSEYLTNTKTGKSYLNNLLVTSHSRISMETVKKKCRPSEFSGSPLLDSLWLLRSV